MLHLLQQNGLAEQWNCTILDKACVLIHSASLTLGFWKCAIDTAVHIYNCTLTQTIGWCTSHELWTYRHVLDISYFCVFRSKAYVHTPESKWAKLDLRLIEMMLVSYEPGSKGYQLWNHKTRSIVLSHDVTFDKRCFPYKEIAQSTAAPSQPRVLDGLVTIQYNMPDNLKGGTTPQVPTVPTIPIVPTLPITPAQPTSEWAEMEFHTLMLQPAAPTPSQCLQCQRIWQDPEVLPRCALRGSSLGSVEAPPLGCLHPNLWSNSRYQQPEVVVHERCQSGTHKEKVLWHLALLHMLVYVAATKYQDLVTFKKVVNSALADEWKEAFQYEIDALAKNGTWVLVELPPGWKVIKSKWVFKCKINFTYCVRFISKTTSDLQLFSVTYSAYWSYSLV